MFFQKLSKIFLIIACIGIGYDAAIAEFEKRTSKTDKTKKDGYDEAIIVG